MLLAPAITASTGVGVRTQLRTPLRTMLLECSLAALQTNATRE
jgi:hypothetical protein